MSAKPTYLGLLNAIAVGGAGALGWLTGLVKKLVALVSALDRWRLQR